MATLTAKYPEILRQGRYFICLCPLQAIVHQRQGLRLLVLYLKDKIYGSHLLVVHVAGAPDECGPAFRMELQGGDAVPSVSLPGDLWSQNLQAVPGRHTCKNKVCDNLVINLLLLYQRRTVADIYYSVLHRDL